MQLNDISLQIADSLFSLLNAVKEICIGRTAFWIFQRTFLAKHPVFSASPEQDRTGFSSVSSKYKKTVNDANQCPH